MVDADKKIVEGTEHHTVKLRIRDGGIKEIIKGLGPGGFCMTGRGRMCLTEDSIHLEFCANVGTYDTRILALGFDVDIPLTEEEIKFSKAEAKLVTTEEVLENVTDPVAAVPAVVAPAQLSEGQTDGHTPV